MSPDRTRRKRRHGRRFAPRRSRPVACEPLAFEATTGGRGACPTPAERGPCTRLVGRMPRNRRPVDVPDNEPASDAQCSGDLGECCGRVRDVLEDLDRRRGIEAGVVHWKCRTHRPRGTRRSIALRSGERRPRASPRSNPPRPADRRSRRRRPARQGRSRDRIRRPRSARRVRPRGLHVRGGGDGGRSRVR